MDEKDLQKLKNENLDNWMYLINKNDNFSDSEDLKAEERQKADLPFFPLSMEKKDFDRIFREIYIHFINPKNATSLELILEENNTIKTVYLSQAKKDNTYKKFQEIKLEEFPLKKIQKDGENNIQKIFERLEDWIKQAHNIDLGNIRFINESAIHKFVEIYSKNQQSSKDHDIFHLIGRYLDQLIDSLNKNQLEFYPQPAFFKFLLNLQKVWKHISFSHIFRIFRDNFPEKEFSIILFGNDWEIPFIFTITKHDTLLRTLTIPNIIINNHEDKIERRNELVKHIKKVYKTKNNFLLNLQDSSQWFKELFRSKLPLSSKRRELIFEKLLFIYKNLGSSWDYEPKNFNSYGGMRYFMYLLGFRYFTKKLSYWSIPNMLSLFGGIDFGLSTKICFIISEGFTYKTKSINASSFILKQLNGQFKNIKWIELEENKGDLSDKLVNFSNLEKVSEDLLKDLKNNLMDNFGNISHIIWINTEILKDLLDRFVFKLHSFGFTPIKLKSILKVFQNKKYIRIYPEPPLFQRFQEQGTFKLLREISPIFTDLHEF